MSTNAAKGTVNEMGIVPTAKCVYVLKSEQRARIRAMVTVERDGDLWAVVVPCFGTYRYKSDCAAVKIQQNIISYIEQALGVEK